MPPCTRRRIIMPPGERYKGHGTGCRDRLLAWFIPLPRRHRTGIGPQSYPRFSCCRFQPFQHCIPRRILPVPPARHARKARRARLVREAKAEGRSFWNFILQPSNPCHPTILARLSRPPFWDGAIVCVKLTPTDDSFTKVSKRETVLRSFASAGPAMLSWRRLHHDRPDWKNLL